MGAVVLNRVTKYIQIYQVKNKIQINLNPFIFTQSKYTLTNTHSFLIFSLTFIILLFFMGMSWSRQSTGISVNAHQKKRQHDLFRSSCLSWECFGMQNAKASKVPLVEGYNPKLKSDNYSKFLLHIAELQAIIW